MMPPIPSRCARGTNGRLTQVNGATLDWDDAGNLLADQDGTRYTYDVTGRMVQAEQGGVVYRYQYNGRGDRLTQSVDGQTTHYTLDIAAGLTQVLHDGTNTYLYGLGRLGEEGAPLKRDVPTAGWVYHLPDALGSVRQLADANGDVTLARSYTPYGEVLDSDGTGSTAYGYTGEWLDDTGLVHLRARYLDPAVGLFTTRDPWTGSLLRPGTMHGWTYVSGNPVNYTDPSGFIEIYGGDTYPETPSWYCQVNPRVSACLSPGKAAEQEKIEELLTILDGSPTGAKLVEFYRARLWISIEIGGPGKTGGIFGALGFAPIPLDFPKWPTPGQRAVTQRPGQIIMREHLWDPPSNSGTNAWRFEDVAIAATLGHELMHVLLDDYAVDPGNVGSEIGDILSGVGWSGDCHTIGQDWFEWPTRRVEGKIYAELTYGANLANPGSYKTDELLARFGDLGRTNDEIIDAINRRGYEPIDRQLAEGLVRIP